jgi:quercetin dioxygenase-like cupin family protein
MAKMTPAERATEEETRLERKRVFVREVSGEYNLSHELKRLRSLPRVRKGKELEFHGGPQQFNRGYLEPHHGLGQTLHIHLEEFAPGGRSQKHGHVNEAVFYILDGEGAEIHDGIRYEWEAGDAAIVHNNCVHQHFNRSETKPARALVMKTKPMYIFMNMLFQKNIEKSPKEQTPNGIGFEPREDVHDFDHEQADHEHTHDHEHAHGHTH